MTIITHPNKILRAVSEEVTTLPVTLAQDLIDTMYLHNGKGLSAIQIGIPLRVFVVDIKDQPVVMVNPYIVYLEELRKFKEGCLSFPGKYATTDRYEKCTVTYHTPHNEPSSMVLEGFDSVAVQHEIEHLDGKLMIDKMGPLTRRLFLQGKL